MTILIEGVIYKQTLLNYSITESPVNPSIHLFSHWFIGFRCVDRDHTDTYFLSVHNIAYKVKRFQGEFKVNL